MNDNMKIKYFDEELEVYDERRIVNKNTYSITLNYVPSPTRPLTVENGKTTLTETNGTPNANQYVLDRENGLLLFNQAMKGKVMTINYSAIGLWCISADKVYTNVDNKGKIVETLEDLMKENRQAIESIKTVGDASTVITQLQANIDSVAGLAGNIAEGSSVNEELTQNIESGEGVNATLTNTISSANNKINEMNTWVNQHENIVNLDNRVDIVEDQLENYETNLLNYQQKSDNDLKTISKNVIGAINEINNNNINIINDFNSKINSNNLLNKSNYSNNEIISSTLLTTIEDKDNLQSVCYKDNYLYLGFDLATDDNGRIDKYDFGGNKISSSGTIKIGHTSSISHRKSNDRFYVCNGGGDTPTKVFTVNPSTFAIEKTLDLSNLGNSGLIAIDNERDRLLVHTSVNDNGILKFNFIDFEGNVLSYFNIDNLGTPQGLTIYDNVIYYLTSRNLYCLNFNGEILYSCTIYLDESETQGLTIGKINGSDCLMFCKNIYNSDGDCNSIYAITNMECNKKTSLRLMGSFSRQESPDIFLTPVMINFGVRKIDGVWTVMNWGNMVSCSKNIIKSIKAGMNSSGHYDVTVTLNTKIYSYAQCIATPEQGLFIDGYDCHGQLNGDNQSVSIKIKKSNADELVDPNTLKDGHGVLITLIGGAKF